MLDKAKLHQSEIESLEGEVEALEEENDRLDMFIKRMKRTAKVQEQKFAIALDALLRIKDFDDAGRATMKSPTIAREAITDITLMEGEENGK